MKDFNDWINDNILDKNIKNIGLELSGGVDSAYILFLLCKFFTTNKTSHRILPIHGYDEIRKYANSIAAAQAVIDVIKKRVSNAPIDNMFIFKYDTKFKENKMPKDLQPCKKCWWCKEKYDAFGMYDGRST
jgi:NH3-dependent NAD+ synthetase